jgi:hypothetical protein
MCTEQQSYFTLQNSSVSLQTNILHTPLCIFLMLLSSSSYFLSLGGGIRKAQVAGKYNLYKRKVVITQSVVRRHLVKKQVAVMLSSQFEEIRMKLLRLWDLHHVPKLYRAVFMLVYNSVTVSFFFYFYVHCGNYVDPYQISNLFILLEEEKRLSSSAEHSSPPAMQEKVYREEQQFIYELLRGYNPEGGINQLYITWGVDSTGKKRKLHFCEKLFANPTSWQDSFTSAELLCKMATVFSLCEEVVGRSSTNSSSPSASSSSSGGGTRRKRPQTLKDFAVFAVECHQKMVTVANSFGGGGCVLL